MVSRGLPNLERTKSSPLILTESKFKKIIREYKKLKKYQKSSMFELEKLSGQETQIDKLVDEYGIDSEAIE